MNRVRRGGAAVWRFWNTAWMARWGRFVLFQAMVLANFAYLRFNPASEHADAWLVLYIALTAALVAFTTMLGVFVITRAWLLRSVGLTGFALGTYVVFQASAGMRFGWFTVRPWMLDLGRSYFAVGLTVLNVGMVLWLWRLWRSYRANDSDIF